MKFNYKNRFNSVYLRKDSVDYKDPKLVDYVTENVNKIIPRRVVQTKACLHRKLILAVKRARYLALLPYCGKHERSEGFSGNSV